MTILTQADLERITGYPRPSAQARWLEARGWKFLRNSKGAVVVHELEAQRQLCGTSKPKDRTQANLDALRE